MAKVLVDPDGVAHLRGVKEGMALCGESAGTDKVQDGELTCPACAKVALDATELVTKVERRSWRKL